jgi:arsenate reductase
VHPEVVAAMAELGQNLTGRTPKRLERDDAEWADVVVTMGCGDECPVVPGTRYVDWELPDPAGRGPEEVRAIRDEIGRRVEGLLREL